MSDDGVEFPSQAGQFVRSERVVEPPTDEKNNQSEYA